MKNFIEKINNFLNNTNKEDAFIQYSCDDKGYIWIKDSFVKEFDEILLLSGIHFDKYDNGNKPIDKVIGQHGYSHNYTEFSYIPIYDLFEVDYSNLEKIAQDDYQFACDFVIFDLFEKDERIVFEDETIEAEYNEMKNYCNNTTSEN